MSQIHKVLYDFDAEEDGEMTVRVGDVVKLLPQSEGPDGDDDDRNGWKFVKATRTGQRGYVPSDYIEPTQSPAAMMSPTKGGGGGGQLHSHSEHTPSQTSNRLAYPPAQNQNQNQTPIQGNGQDQNQDPGQSPHSYSQGTPEVGMRLSMAALVNPPPGAAQTYTQPQPSSTIPAPLADSTLPPPPPPSTFAEPDSSSSNVNVNDPPKQYGMDKKPFGMDVVDSFPSPGKRSKGGSINSFAKSAGTSKGGGSSSSKSKMSGLNKFKKAGNMVQNMVRVSSAVAAPRVPSLASAVDREDWDELTKRNDEYFARLVSSQAETFDSLTDMVDALSKKLNDATKSSHDLVSKLSELDELIDEEKRKWKSQNEAEKNAEVLGRSKQLMVSTDGGAGGSSSYGSSNSRGGGGGSASSSSPRPSGFSPRGQ